MIKIILYTDTINTCSFSFKVKPLIAYSDSYLSKYNVLKDNKDKSGIYIWINRIDNKSYAGSSINLSSILRNYYSINYLNRKVLITNSRIYKALLLHGHKNFYL